MSENVSERDDVSAAAAAAAAAAAFQKGLTQCGRQRWQRQG